MCPAPRLCRCLSKSMIIAVLFTPALAAVRVDASPAEFELLTFDDLVFEGAVRVPADTFGESSLNFSEGPIAYNGERHSLYMVGHSHHQAIAEFDLPPLTISNDILALQMAGPPLQPFVTVLDRASGGNPQDLNRVGGLAWFPTAAGSELLVNGYEYYDAPGDNTETTMVLRDGNDLVGSAADGFFTFEGGAGHTSGWISPVPASWQTELGGGHITGQSSGLPIISRLSVGPSAFAFDVTDVVESSDVPEPIPTTALLDFSLANPLHADLSNDSRENDLWTHLSRVVYGFVVPGTRTYATFGHSGGHESGVCYKCIQTDGHECGGYCPPDPNDLYLYYWFWDVDDLIDVKNGLMFPHDVRPYEYGELPAAFPATELGGGAWDPVSGLLYLTLQRADREQGTYANPPVVVAYSFDLPTAEVEPGLERGAALRAFPNPSSGRVAIEFHVRTAGRVKLEVFDAGGRRLAVPFHGVADPGDHLVSWDGQDGKGRPMPSGVYHYRVETEDGHVTRKLFLAR